MLIKRKPHRKFTELESKSYIREYLSSSDRRKTFERCNGLRLITAAVQSSTATTVMTVSFVNAGLLTLAHTCSCEEFHLPPS